MGCVKNLTKDKRPEQGGWVGKRAEVCFNYDTSKRFPGKVIRDDREEPFETIILLDDGFPVKTSECQWRPVD